MLLSSETQQRLLDFEAKLPKQKSGMDTKGVTLPKFNSSHLKIGLPKRKLVFQPPIFRGYVKLRGVLLDSSPFLNALNAVVKFLFPVDP